MLLCEGTEQKVERGPSDEIAGTSNEDSGLSMDCSAEMHLNVDATESVKMDSELVEKTPKRVFGNQKRRRSFHL